MFVQVVQGRVSDAAAVRAHIDKWEAEIAPGATGWLGSTGGVTEDGQLIALVRFESEEAAQQNSDRPEQSAWWEGMAALFTDEPTFKNSTVVDAETYGDPNQAGFVQVMQGRTSDFERSREVMAADPEVWQAFRPDILATLNAGHEGGEWTMALYFTSEADAREGEQKEPPAELASAMEEMQSLELVEPTYLDLKDPWLSSP